MAGALDLRTRSGEPKDSDPDLDLDPLWARPELYARLIQAVVNHAAGRQPDTIVALGEAALPLAAPVALRLGVPLQLRPEHGEGRGDVSRECPYLVAGVLRPPDSDGAGPTVADRTRRAAGAAAVAWTGGESDFMDHDNCLFILTLDDSF